MILMSAALFAAEPLSIDLPTAVDAAWRHAAGAAVANARVARARSRTGFQLDDPQVRLRATELGSKLDPVRWRVQVRQDVNELFTAGADAKVRRSDVLIEEAELGVLRERSRIATVRRFDQTRLLDAERALIAQEKAVVQRRLEVVQKRLGAGLPVEKDVVDAAFDLAEMDRREALLIQDLRVAKADLLASMGEAADSEVNLQGPDLRETLEAALSARSTHLEVRVADARVQEAVLERKAASAAKIPFLDWVQGQVIMEPDRVPVWGISTALQVPVFSLLDKSVASAKKGLALREAEKRRLEHEHAVVQGRDRVALDAARATLKQIDALIERARGALDTHRERLTPDEVLAFEAKLLGERRRSLGVIEDGLEARRRLEAPVRGSP